MKIINLNENTRKELLLQLQKRSPSSYGGYEQTVNEIIENVRQHGDKAPLRWNRSLRYLRSHLKARR